MARALPSDHPEDERGSPMPVRARRRLAAGASAALAGQLSTVLSNVVTSIFIAQMFGPAGTGTYALIVNLFAAVILLAALGLPTGITFLVSRRSWSLRAAFRQSLGAAVPMGLAGMGAGLAFYAITDRSILDGVTVVEAVAVLGAAPFGLAWLFCGALALARDLYGRYAALQLFQSGATATFVVVLGISFGLSGAVVGFALAQIVSAAQAAGSLRRSVHDEVQEHAAPFHDRAPTRPLRAALRFGARAWSADVLQFLNYRLDLFVLAAFASRADVGRYSLAVSLTMLAWLAPAAIGQVLLPRTASLDSAADAGEVTRQQADDATARVIRHTVLLQLPTGAVVAAILFAGIPLIYGHAFHQSIALGLLLLPGVLLAGVAKVVSPAVTGRGYPIYALYNVLITVPVTLALYGVMIPTLGATGAALASSVSYTLTTVLALCFYRRATGASVRAAVVPSVTDLREYPLTASQLLAAGRALLSGHRGCASS